MHPNFTPNDIYYSGFQRGLENTFSDVDIDMSRAWDVTTGSSSIRVGVISSRYINECYGFTALSTSPNPASTSLTVELMEHSGNTGPYKIELRNSSGNVIKSLMTSGNKSVINTEDVPNGMYILRILQKDGMLSQRIVIRR